MFVKNGRQWRTAITDSYKQKYPQVPVVDSSGSGKARFEPVWLFQVHMLQISDLTNYAGSDAKGQFTDRPDNAPKDCLIQIRKHSFNFYKMICK